MIFTGKLTGEFIALDEDTGKTLWQFKTGSSVNSTAITYTHNGRQYVTIASGLGGALATRYAAAKVPAGGSIWTFALFPANNRSLFSDQYLNATGRDRRGLPTEVSLEN